MSLIKPKACHGSTYNVWKYLEYDAETGRERAIGHDSSMVIDPEGQWWREMDSLVRQAGHTKRTRVGRPRTYSHYVIAPHPDDFVGKTREEGLEMVRRLATDWAGAYLKDYMWEIVYHDDGDNGNIHAHVVSPVTNLATGRKRQEGARDWERAKELANELSRKHGLSAFIDMVGDKELAERLGEQNAERRSRGEEEVAKTVLDRQAVAERVEGQAEKYLSRRGEGLWKDEVRLAVDEAVRDSHDFASFKRALRALQVDVYVNKGGQLVYRYGDKKVAGAKLGLMYQTDFLASRFMDLRFTKAAWQAKSGDYRTVENGTIRIPKVSTEDVFKVASARAKYRLRTEADASRSEASARDRIRRLIAAEEAQERSARGLERDLRDAEMVSGLAGEMEKYRTCGRLAVPEGLLARAREYEAARKRLERRGLRDGESIRAGLKQSKADLEVLREERLSLERMLEEIVFARARMRDMDAYIAAGAEWEARRYGKDAVARSLDGARRTGGAKRSAGAGQGLANGHYGRDRRQEESASEWRGAEMDREERMAREQVEVEGWTDAGEEAVADIAIEVDVVGDGAGQEGRDGRQDKGGDGAEPRGYDYVGEGR